MKTNHDTEEEAFREVKRRSRGVEEDVRAEEGGSLPAEEFAPLLNLSSRAVHRLRATGGIFALPKGRKLVYPSWQIHSGQLIPGLDRVLAKLHERRTTAPFAIANFFLTPAEALDGKRPLDLLRKGKFDEVLHHVERWSL